MIAEKLLACATPAPLDSHNTLFLAFAQGTAGGAPEAVIGQLSYNDRIALNGAGGAVLQSGGAASYSSIAAPMLGAGDFLLDVVFDGTNVPSVIAATSFPASVVSVTDGYAYVSTGGKAWDYYVSVSPPSGRNHVAAGRQSGVVQVWLNGVRLLRAVDAGPVGPIPNVTINQYPETGHDITINGIRICYGVDLYGDNANIAVPTLPLGIV